MKQKPSERVKELFKAKPNEVCSDNVYLLRAFDEIGKILDELHEQQKTPEQRQLEVLGTPIVNTKNTGGEWC